MHNTELNPSAAALPWRTVVVFRMDAWVELATDPAPADAPAELAASVALDAATLRRFVVLGELHLRVVTGGSDAAQVARVATDYLEVRLSYRLPPDA